MASAKRIAANRRNARKSTGPRTAEGKARSKMNALKHGLDARTVVLPDEDEAAFRARLDAWRADFPPRDPLESSLLEQAARLSWQLDRADRAQAAHLSEYVRTARDEEARHRDEAENAGRKLLAGPEVPTYDLARIADRLARLADVPALAPYVPACDPYRLAGKRLSRPIHPDDPDHPEKLLRRLESTADGCRWLLDRWNELRAALDRESGWEPDERLRAVRLLGKEPADAIDDPMAQSIYLGGFVLAGHSPQVFADQHAEMTAREFDLFLQQLRGRRVASLVPTSPESAREGLCALVDGLIAMLEVRADAHDAQAGASRSAAPLPFDGSARGERLRRLQGRLFNALMRTVDRLMTIRKQARALAPAPATAPEVVATAEESTPCEKTRNEPNAAPRPTAASRPIPADEDGGDHRTDPPEPPMTGGGAGRDGRRPLDPGPGRDPPIAVRARIDVRPRLESSPKSGGRSPPRRPPGGPRPSNRSDDRDGWRVGEPD